MKTALDTNILSSLISGEPQAPQIDAILRRCLQDGTLHISGIVYTELLAHPQSSKSFLDYFLSHTGVRIDFHIDATIWTVAGTRYAQYAARRRAAVGESPRRIAADFVIGAHALARADRLLTLDKRVYAQDFPELRLIEIGVSGP